MERVSGGREFAEEVRVYLDSSLEALACPSEGSQDAAIYHLSFERQYQNCYQKCTDLRPLIPGLSKYPNPIATNDVVAMVRQMFMTWLAIPKKPPLAIRHLPQQMQTTI